MDANVAGAAEATRVLVVDDEPGLRRSLSRVLESRACQVATAENVARAREVMPGFRPDVMLLDVRMPGTSGFDFLVAVKREHPDVEVILMTAHGDVDTAVAAVKAGAYDFLTKPFVSNDAVVLSVEKAATHRRLVARTQDLERALSARDERSPLIGSSPAMQKVQRVIDGVAASSSTVLVLGESGTGKELVARAIHERSPRKQKPFVVVNCGAIPKDLVESELFGHVRGAFSGAGHARMGLFESANGGTLVLDEIGDLPLGSQVKLLRVLQEGEVRRVGADGIHHVDVRVVAATNAPLERAVQEGSFRADLYYRLRVVTVQLPALRDRGDDILTLAQHFVHALSKRTGRSPMPLSARAKRAMVAYAWPGNVRELEHAIERALLLAPGPEIDVADLGEGVSLDPIVQTSVPPPPPATPRGLGGSFVPFLDKPYADAKREAIAAFDEAYVSRVMEAARGNQSEAARLAALDRSNFRRLLRRVEHDRSGAGGAQRD